MIFNWDAPLLPQLRILDIRALVLAFTERVYDQMMERCQGPTEQQLCDRVARLARDVALGRISNEEFNDPRSQARLALDHLGLQLRLEASFGNRGLLGGLGLSPAYPWALEAAFAVHALAQCAAPRPLYMNLMMRAGLGISVTDYHMELMARVVSMYSFVETSLPHAPPRDSQQWLVVGDAVLSGAHVWTGKAWVPFGAHPPELAVKFDEALLRSGG